MVEQGLVLQTHGGSGSGPRLSSQSWMELSQAAKCPTSPGGDSGRSWWQQKVKNTLTRPLLFSPRVLKVPLAPLVLLVLVVLL